MKKRKMMWYTSISKLLKNLKNHRLQQRKKQYLKAIRARNENRHKEIKIYHHDHNDEDLDETLQQDFLETSILDSERTLLPKLPEFVS